MKRFSLVAALFAALTLSFAASGGNAQDYPSKPITLVIPFAPGGSSDLIARLVSEKMTAALGQTIVIDNRPGAGGSLAAGLVAKAPPDGYTLLFVAAGHAGIGALYPSLTFDPVKDFAPVTHVASSPIVVVVNQASDYKSLQQLVAAAKAQPGKLNFSGGGGGATVTNLAAEVFRKQEGLNVVNVPYKGSGPAVMALLAGEIDYDFDALAAVIGQIRAGKLRALAVTTKARTPALPDVPTVAETVLPGFEAASWAGVLAPKGTPEAVIARLNKEFVAAIRNPDVVKRLGELGVDPVGSSPAEFGRFLTSETERWGGVIRDLGLKP
ncbi:MAG: tripartite tricarboxylate transporter substrate binding protein [Rhodospirillales bacterium]|nr:tripartite tricarboxylate transporter substrate binding protein [Rhodospirillales bacterium]